jgi:hypothetical protein
MRAGGPVGRFGQERPIGEIRAIDDPTGLRVHGVCVFNGRRPAEKSSRPRESRYDGRS